ncbi:MAG: hypothetical protein C5B52_15430 [Bacteroidetes bacterium]|nr:MAG: hypothetical protein C5B52_15430 [Bacteroidota bacterium]
MSYQPTDALNKTRIMKYLSFIIISIALNACSYNTEKNLPQSLGEIKTLAEGEKWAQKEFASQIEKFSSWCKSPDNDSKREMAQQIASGLSDFTYSDGQYNILKECLHLSEKDQKELIKFCGELMRNAPEWKCIEQLIDNNQICEICKSN